ncbi:MAG: nicotinate-nucleotide--dimethylbenzimidazole phosphoribosyltransferase [Actinomycetota bacterium]|nr:nicotinate-nucleotide--dimethylbenzimidazole phosphoribosyltransferase [Actinomycetota bacterium]
MSDKELIEAAAANRGRFPLEAREALDAIVTARRDVRRRFLPDPIPREVLWHVLGAAHRAPSVGLSQPWDFLVITSEEARAEVARHVEEERARYQASLASGRAGTFSQLKVHGIMEAPVLLAVTSTRERGGANVLGRYTQPEATEYSTCLAIQNLWLAARAEGIGVGWVSFYRPEVVAELLNLPTHVKALALLCLGYVDGFDPSPELALFDWASPRPLEWAVHYEKWGSQEVSPLQQALDAIGPLDAEAMAQTRQHQASLTKPAGSLGILEDLSVQLAGISRVAPPRVPESATVAVFAGDHGVVRSGVTPWPSEVTAQMVANFLAGGAAINVIARQVGAEVVVVDVGVATELAPAKGLMRRKVRSGTGDISIESAMSEQEARRAVEVGVEVARELVAAGARVLITGEMGIGNTTPSAALISEMTGMAPAELTGRGTGIDDEMLAHKVSVIEEALRRARVAGDLSDPFRLLAELGGMEIAALAGFVLGAAASRVPVIVDGVIAAAGLGIAARIAPGSANYAIAGHLSQEPAARAMLEHLCMRPLLNLDLRLGEGSGAALAFPLVQAAARVAQEMATFESAGVTRKDGTTPAV